MGSVTFTVRSAARSQLIDITQEVARRVDEAGWEEGVVHVFVPHTTAGITVNEHADPDVAADIAGFLDRAIPWEGGWRHAEGNSAAHVKASLMGSSAAVAVEGGSPVLGTWQGIFFCEFDGPRTRTVRLTWCPSGSGR